MALLLCGKSVDSIGVWDIGVMVLIWSLVVVCGGVVEFLGCLVLCGGFWCCGFGVVIGEGVAPIIILLVCRDLKLA